MVEKFRVLCPQCGTRRNTSAQESVKCKECGEVYDTKRGRLLQLGCISLVQDLAENGPQIRSKNQKFTMNAREVIRQIRIPGNRNNIFYLPGDERRAIQLALDAYPTYFEESSRQKISREIGEDLYALYEEQVAWT